MKLLRLALRDFCCFQSAQIDFGRRPLVLVVGRNERGGSNEAGKSTLCAEALCWVLFGRTAKGASGPDVIRHGQKEAQVALAWQDGDELHELRRTQQSASSGLQFLVGGRDLSASDKRATQRALESYLGFDLEAFKTVLLIGQEGRCFARCSNAERRRLLDRLLGLEILDSVYQGFTRRRNEIASRLSEHQQVLEHRLMPSRQTLQADLASAAQRSASWQRERSDVLQKRVKAMQSLKGMIAEGQRLLDDTAADNQTKSDLVGQAQSRLTEAAGRVAATNQVVVALEVELTALDGALTLGDGGSCPTCLRPLGDQLKQLEAVAAGRRQELQEQLVALDELRKGQRRCQAGLSAAQRQASLAAASLVGCRSDLAALESQLRTLRTLEEREQDPHAQEVARLEGALQRMGQDIVERQVVLTELEAALRIESFWVAALAKTGPLDLSILSEVLRLLSRTATGYVAALLPSAPAIELVAAKRGSQDVIDIVIDNRQGYPLNSGGAKECIDAALCLGLRDLMIARGGRWPDLMVLDEAAAYLDSINIERLAALLNRVASDKLQIWVVSHRPELAASFEDVITVVKERGVARIEGNDR